MVSSCTTTQGFLLVSLLWHNGQIDTLVSIPGTFYLLEVSLIRTLKLLHLFVSELSLLTDFKLTNIHWDRYVTRLYPYLFRTHFSHYCQFKFSVNSPLTILFNFSLNSVFLLFICFYLLILSQRCTQNQWL